MDTLNGRLVAFRRENSRTLAISRKLEFPTQVTLLDLSYLTCQDGLSSYAWEVQKQNRSRTLPSSVLELASLQRPLHLISPVTALKAPRARGAIREPPESFQHHRRPDTTNWGLERFNMFQPIEQSKYNI